MPQDRPKLLIRAALALCLLFYAGLAVAQLHFAPLNQDEGWYLMSALRVADGKMPFLDFAYTQGPVMPWVYAAAAPLIRCCGVLGGRLLTFFLAALTLLLLLRALRRTPGRPGSASLAVVLGLALLGVNSFQLQYTCTVKTYALAGLFLLAGAVAFVHLLRSRCLPYAALSALCFALAAGTRLSLGLAFIPVGLHLLLHRTQAPRYAWLLFGLTGAAALLLLFGPALLYAPDALRFGLLEYHKARETPVFWMLKAGFLSRSVQAYLVASVLVAGLVLLPRARRSNAATLGSRPLWWAVGLISLAHIAAPFPYDDYQVAVYPLAVFLIARALATRIAVRRQAPAALMAALACVAAAMSSPVLQDWFLLRRDRIWWLTKPQADLALLQQVAADLRQSYPHEKSLLTPDLYLAVEAGMQVPAGFEMGPFGFAPDWPEDRTSALHLLSMAALEREIRSGPCNLAATSGYAFTILCPSVTEVSAGQQAQVQSLLRRYFRPVRHVPDFGQGLTTLTLWERIARAED